MKKPSRATAALLCCAAFGMAHADGHRRTGDVLRFAIPAATLGVEWWRGEREGALQYGQSLAVELLATEALQRTTRVERPDRSNDRSFPSGHATLAFSAATYAHRRYGLQSAWPLYALGTYVGYTRVHANRHRWADVAGSAALCGAAAWWLVEPRGARQLALIPQIDRNGASLWVSASW